MSAGLLLQYVVIAIAVMASAGYAIGHRFPLGVRRLRILAAVPLVRAGRARWMQGVGHWLAPAPDAGGNGCGSCGGCDKS